MAGRALLEGSSFTFPTCRTTRIHLYVAQIGLVFRTALGIPMLREGVPIGVIALSRSEARPFTDKQIELVTTFADQAAIAIENVRLFDEVQAKTRDLSEALTYQTGSEQHPERDRLFADRCRTGSQGHRRKRLRALRGL